MSDVVIPNQDDYPSILKYMVEGEGADRITDLEMDHIKSLFFLVYYKLLQTNRKQTVFSVKVSKELTLMEYAEKYFPLYTKEQLIKVCRILNIDYIIDFMIEWYKEHKISYKRSGRMEIINKSLKKYEQELMTPEREGDGLKEK